MHLTAFTENDMQMVPKNSHVSSVHILSHVTKHTLRKRLMTTRSLEVIQES